jgi:lysozyme family protein
MPSYFVATIHGLECSYSFDQHLHHGDPNQRKDATRPRRPAAGHLFTFQMSTG